MQGASEDEAPLPEKPRKSLARRIVALVVIVAVAWWFLTAIWPLLVSIAPTESKREEFLDSMSLVRIATVIRIAQSRSDVLLAPDGRIDVYRLLIHDGEEREEGIDKTLIVDLCHGARASKGPTWEEIEAGDYRSFPYQRYRGHPPPDAFAGARGVPILWDRRPSGGKRLAVHSGGAVTAADEAAMQGFFRKHPGQE